MARIKFIESDGEKHEKRSRNINALPLDFYLEKNLTYSPTLEWLAGMGVFMCNLKLTGET